MPVNEVWVQTRIDQITRSGILPGQLWADRKGKRWEIVTTTLIDDLDEPGVVYRETLEDERCLTWTLSLSEFLSQFRLAVGFADAYEE